MDRYIKLIEKIKSPTYPLQQKINELRSEAA